MAKPQELRLLLVQSGTTEWTDSERVQGSTDLPMSRSGLSSATTALDGVEIPALAAIFSSPDEASTKTAGIVSERAGARVKSLRELHEVDLGLWEGLLEGDVSERYPKAFRQWQADPRGIAPPDGETIADAEARLLTALSRSIDKTGPGPVCVVVRPIAAAILRRLLVGESQKRVWDYFSEGASAAWHDTSRQHIKAAKQEAQSGV